MQISSINDIIQGELLNSPAISFIYNIKTDVKKIQEGDLFFAFNEEEIPSAIKQGAFAIVIQKSMEILDNEIAWIYVENLQLAIIKYIRYQLSQLELKAYWCDTISYELLKTFSHHFPQTPNIWLFSNNLNTLLARINEIKHHDIIISNNQETLNAIYPYTLPFNTHTFKIDNLIEHSLFETSFSYKQEYFLRLKISSLFIHQFLEVVNFIGTPLDFNKLKKINYFKPIFIDKFFNACEYGKSDKFVLIQEKKNLAQKELEYLYTHYKYAKTVILSKEPLTFDGFEIVVVPQLEEIYQTLQHITFNALYIVGFKKQKVESLFKNNHSTNALL